MATASRSDGIPGSTPPQAAASAQQPATSSHDSLAVARQDLDVLLGDLAGVCGQLEELATTLRREHTSGTSRRQLPLAFPHIVNLMTDPKEREPYNPVYLHTWTMAHFGRLLAEFKQSVAQEPLIPAGASLDFVPHPP